MKIAAFNVENLFDRPKVFNKDDETSSKIISAKAELNTIFEKANYSNSDKARIKELLEILGLDKSDNGKYAIIRKIRGRLLSRPRNAPLSITANGRHDWVGWAELKNGSVNEIAIQNTGRVIRDVNADILAVVEAENRITLKQFNQEILKEINGTPYKEVMLVDGNDDRGIDLGIMTQNGYTIKAIRSHIHDLNSKGYPIFSRDCPEYQIITPSGEVIWVLPNHFKSKYGGNDSRSKKKRLDQAQKTVEIYEKLINEGYNNVIVLGDLNDTPDSEELKPLVVDTNLKDVSEHPTFDPGQFPEIGTFGLGNNEDKIDFLLLSPTLFNNVQSSGLFRKGAWPGSRPKRWDKYPEIKRKIHVASDHHVIWADINI